MERAQYLPFDIRLVSYNDLPKNCSLREFEAEIQGRLLEPSDETRLKAMIGRAKHGDVLDVGGYRGTSSYLVFYGFVKATVAEYGRVLPSEGFEIVRSKGIDYYDDCDDVNGVQIPDDVVRRNPRCASDHPRFTTCCLMFNMKCVCDYDPANPDFVAIDCQNYEGYIDHDDC